MNKPSKIIDLSHSAALDVQGVAPSASALDKIKVIGGQQLNGIIPISGAKNCALKLMCASILTEETLRLENMPNSLRDIASQVELLDYLGCTVEGEGDIMAINAGTITTQTAPYDIVRKMRGSILVLGPLLARFGHAKVSLPGGCAIGTRPVDMHIKALEEMGAQITLEEGYINAKAPKGGLQGAKILFPKVSVGATENLMMAATLAKGATVLANAAREPEINDLGECLIAMGAKIEGLGTDTIRIEGVPSLGGAHHRVIADRIETGTYMLAAIMHPESEITITHSDPDDLGHFIEQFKQTGATISVSGTDIYVKAPKKINPVSIITDVYPGFPTDLQAQWATAMTLADGKSVITDTIYTDRFSYVPELNRLGASLEIAQNSVHVLGNSQLSGASIMSTDLRASVSLVLAAMVAEGNSEVLRIYHLDRGYEFLEKKLNTIGAKIKRVKE